MPKRKAVKNGRAKRRDNRAAGRPVIKMGGRGVACASAESIVGAWDKLVRFACGGKGRRGDKAAARAMADEVSRHRDLIAVAVQLLDSDKHTVVARVWERLLEYRFGRPAQMIEASGPGGGPVVVKIISHVPRPDRAAPVEAT